MRVASSANFSSMRPTTFQIWSNVRNVPGERLAAFESWLWEEMVNRLVWPREEATRARMIGQCRTFILSAVADMDRHGFLFQPRPLAALLREKLDQIGTLQRQGKVQNLYPYFRACWQGWVRREADDLRDQAMSAGSHVTQIMASLQRPAPAGPSMPDVVAQSLREQAAAARRKHAGATPVDSNLKLKI